MKYIVFLLVVCVSLPSQILQPIIGTKSGFTYYVDPAGSDSNPGTMAQPWATVAKVNATTLSPGQSVGFKRGGVWRETLTAPSSGSAGSPITFGAYGSGAQPTFNGSNLVTTWTADGGTSVETKSYTLNENDGATTSYGWRLVLPGATFTNNGTGIRVSVKGRTDQSTTIVGMSIGKQSGTYNQDATDRVQITFGGGNAGVVLAAGGTATSDTIAYNTTASNVYVLAYDTNNGYYSDGFHTGNTYYKTGSLTDYNTASVSGYSALTVVSSISAIAIDYSTAGVANVWNAAVTTQPNLVHTDGAIGTKGASKAALSADGTWFWAANVLSLYSATNPNARTVEAGARAAAIDSNSKNYIAFSGLHATKANGDYGGGFKLSSAPQYVTIEGSTSDSNYGAGVAISGANSDHVSVIGSLLAGNQQYGLATLHGGNTNHIYSGNTIHHNGNVRSDDYYSGIDELNVSGSIDHNTIYANGSPAGEAGHEHGVYHNAGITSSVVSIHDNVLYGHTEGAGVMVKSGATIYNNLSYSNGADGISTGQNTTATALTIYGNVCWGNVTGISVKNKGASALSAAIYHNTLYSNGASAEVFIGDNLTSLDLRDNLIYAGATGSVASIVAQSAATIDSNLWYRAAGFNGTYGGVGKNWTQWKAIGFDANGINSDPLFTNAATADFTLQPGSPAIGAGTYIAGVSTSNPPSIGAK